MSLKTVIHGSNGKISTMRVATLALVASILGVFIAHNVVSMVHGGGFISMGYQEAALLASALGLKVLQRKIEGTSPLDGPDDSTPSEAAISTTTPAASAAEVPADIKAQ